MAASNLPGIGLKGYAPRGEHEWDTWMNANLLMLSGIAQLSVRSRTQNLNTSASAQIAPSGHAQAGRIALYFEGAHTFITPQEGWTAYVRDEDEQLVFNDGAWRPISGRNSHVIHGVVTQSTNIPEAALRKGAVIVVDSQEPVTLTITPTPAGAETPDGSTLPRQPTTVVQKGVGPVTIAASAGITIISPDMTRKTRTTGSCVSLIPISEGEFVLAGDIVP